MTQSTDDILAGMAHHMAQLDRQSADWKDIAERREAELSTMLAIIGTETPIAALTLAETWRAEKAGYMEQVSKVNHVLADMVNQYMAAKEGYITHEFMSAQEDAIEYLEDIGWLRAGELERYYWTDAALAATKDDPPPLFYGYRLRITELTTLARAVCASAARELNYSADVLLVSTAALRAMERLVGDA